MTYGKGGTTVPTVIGAGTGALLPVTGATSNFVVALAVAIAVGLVDWGVIYAVNHRAR